MLDQDVFKQISMFCNNSQINQKVDEELPKYTSQFELIKSVNAANFELPLKGCSSPVIDKFRVACGRWKVDLKPPQAISSHRPIIGPVIVFAKKMIYPILRNLLRDYTREQKEFNAATLAILAELTQANKN